MPDTSAIFDEHAEISVCGALLLDPSCLNAFDLADTEFYLPQCAAFYRAVIALKHDRSEPVDIVTVSEELQRQGAKTPTDATIADWAARVPTAANVGVYAAIVREYAQKRRSVIAAKKCLTLARDSDRAEVYSTLEKCQSLLADAYDVHAQADSLRDLIGQVTPSELVKALPVIPTGLSAIDRLIGGIPLGLSIVAARPSQGKSSLCRIIAMNVAERGIGVGYVSLEEDRQQFLRNLAITRGLVDSEHVTRGSLSGFESDRFKTALGQLSAFPIFVCDDRPLTGEAACSRIRMMHARHKIGIAFVDYWNRLTMGTERALREEANAYVTMFSALSKRLGIPVVVVAQLNRDSDKEQRRPRMSDLKESGGWEEAANLVILCHREGFYKDSEPQDEIDLIIAKSKTTRTGKVRGAWCGRYLWVGDEQPRDPDARTQGGFKRVAIPRDYHEVDAEDA